MSAYTKKGIKQDSQNLTEWYLENYRPLPWRESRDPYKIWISEVMLQQTTVKAVIPYFKNFMEKFPTCQDLAKARIEDIYEAWAGLGYYSRARNIHKAAIALSAKGQFPKTHQQLLLLPGFGDYISRAVSSQAFAEPVGVVDGNVIRVLSRRFNLPVEHWRQKEKKVLQEIADQFAQHQNPSDLNQAMMELGATICSNQNPTCLICPIKKNCLALKADTIEKLPLKKPKKAFEIWQWDVELYEHKGQLALVSNNYAPFLKKQLILPGRATQKKTAPKTYDFQHSITHHKIYVKISRVKSKFKPADFADFIWLTPKQLKQKAPFSLIQKTIALSLVDK